MLHCDLRMRWKVASDLRFRAAMSEPKTPSFCRISGKLPPSTRKSLAIASVRFWCAKFFLANESREDPPIKQGCFTCTGAPESFEDKGKTLKKRKLLPRKASKEVIKQGQKMRCLRGDLGRYACDSDLRFLNPRRALAGCSEKCYNGRAICDGRSLSKLRSRWLP